MEIKNKITARFDALKPAYINQSCLLAGLFNFDQLNEKVRYTLSATERLKSRKAIEQLFREGKAFSHFPFRVIWMPVISGPAPLQAGFSASSRNFKKAVDRNRIKRLIKEAYRLQKHDLQVRLQNGQKQLVIFFIYTGNEIPNWELISGKMNSALNRLIKFIDEDHLANT